MVSILIICILITATANVFHSFIQPEFPLREAAIRCADINGDITVDANGAEMNLSLQARIVIIAVIIT